MVRITQEDPTEITLSPTDADTRTREPIAAGSRLILSAGHYPRPLRFVGLRGTVDSPIVITGEPQAVVDPRQNAYACITLTDCRYVAVQGLTVRNAHDAGLRLCACHHCLLLDCAVSRIKNAGLAIHGYSLPLPTCADHAWQWYRQLPLSTGIWVVNCRFDQCRVDMVLDRVAESEFVANDARRVRLQHAMLNRFRGDRLPELEEEAGCVHNLLNPTDLPWQESPRWPEKPLARTRPARVADVTGRRAFSDKVAARMPDVCDFRFTCDDTAFERIVNNNLWLLAQHMDERGAMLLWPPFAAYEELCYYDPIDEQQHVVHGRDSMEAAQTLIAYGAADIGARAIAFNIACGITNQSWGYAGERDPSQVGQQVDVVTHLVRAVDAHRRYTGSTDLVDQAWDGMCTCMRESDVFFEPRLGLYVPPPGEQMAVDCRAAFLFENCSLLDACRRLARMANQRGDATSEQWFTERAEALRAGIDSHLRCENGYVSGVVVEGDRVVPFEPQVVGWQMLPFRYYSDADAEALERTYQRAQQDRVPWGGYYPVLTRWVDQRGGLITMTKDVGSLMGYEARTGRFASLGAHIEWVKAMCVKPGTCLPDHWGYYRRATAPGTPWIGWLQEPDGDITLGVNNCEQVAEWLVDLLHNLLGIRAEVDGLVIQPALPWTMHTYAVSGVPIPSDLGGGQVGYRLRRDDRSIRLVVDLPPQAHATVRVGVPRTFAVGRTSHPFVRRPGAELEWLDVCLTGPGTIEIDRDERT